MAPSPAELACSSAHVQPLWGQLQLADRAHYLLRAAQAIVDERDALARALGEAHGRPPGDVLTLDLLPAIDGLSWLAENGVHALRERRLGAPRGTHPLTRARLAWDPLGVVCVVAGAGAPFAVPLWRVGAALLAGDGVLLVPGDGTEGAVAAIARAFARAGLPEGLVAVADGADGLADAAVAKVFAPGDERWRELAAELARRGVLAELDTEGGAGAVVLADAGVPRAARGVANAAFAGAGRTAGAARRAWVAGGLEEAFTAAVARAAAGYPPVADEDGAAAAQVAAAVAEGARLLTGGPGPDGRFAPAVVAGVTDDMAVAREPSPAPLLAVSAVASTGEAIAAANASRLRAGVSVWTASRHEGVRVARELRASPAWLNDHLVGPSLPAVPWGPGVGGDAGVQAFAAPRAVSWEGTTGAAFWWGPYDEGFSRAAQAVVRLRSLRDRDRERALRDGTLPIARVAARALRARGRRG